MLSKEEIKTKYNEYLSQGRISFITFHPSYSYEDFIEGIRPDIEKGQGFIVNDGVFKEMAINAAYDSLELETNTEDIDFKNLIKNFQEEFQVGSILKTVNETEFSIEEYTEKSIRIRPRSGQNIYSISYEPLKEMFLMDKETPIATPRDLFKRTSQFEGLSSYYFVILKKISFYKQIDTIKTVLTYEDKKETVLKYLKNPNQIKTKSNPQKYVIIIDEINRGDISKIFGELITLIESDKRLGCDNQIIVELPYSRELFCVPANLYIMGTMNTADRSLALLDVALRRRFDFIEMPPKLDELLGSPASFGTTYDVAASVNAIKVLNKTLGDNPDIGKDKKIGHAFMCNIKDESQLFNAWKNKIMPLLEEYYYFDRGQLEVLSDSIYKQASGWDYSRTMEFINHLNIAK